METTRPGDSHLPLRRNDQRVVGAIVALALAALVVARIVLGGWRGGALVEIDRTEGRTAAYQVDINRATWVELAQLPGVGETLAKRIVRFRRDRGRLVTNRAILDVHGIGPRTLTAMIPFLKPLPADDTPPAGPKCGPVKSRRNPL